MSGLMEDMELEEFCTAFNARRAAAGSERLAELAADRREQYAADPAQQAAAQGRAATQRQQRKRAKQKRTAAPSSSDEESDSSGAESGGEAPKPAATLVEAIRGHFHMDVRFPTVDRADAVTWNEYLAAMPDARQQDLPPGSQVPQMPYTAHVDLAAKLHCTAAAKMPDHVCAVCSRARNRLQTAYYQWGSIPNMELLRADVMRTAAVPRPANVVHWRRVAVGADGQPPAPPAAAPPVGFRLKRKRARAEPASAAAARPGPGSTDPARAPSRPGEYEGRPPGGAHGGGTGAYGFASDVASGSAGGAAPRHVPHGGSDGGSDADDQALRDYARSDAQEAATDSADDVPIELYPFPSREDRRPRACSDDPAFAEVAYCLRYDKELPNRTVVVEAATGEERLCVCSECFAALKGNKVPEAALARLDGGDIPEKNHLGDPLPMPTPFESSILGLVIPMQQLYIVQAANRPPDLRPAAVRAHGIFFAAPGPTLLGDTIPMRAEEFAGCVDVYHVDLCCSREELVAKLKSARAFQVRGQVLVAWVRFLQHVDDKRQVDEEALADWVRRCGPDGAVPQEVLAKALAPMDPEVAALLRTKFNHDRAGNTTTQQQQQRAEASAAAAPVGGAFAGPAFGVVGAGLPRTAVQAPAASGSMGPSPPSGVPEEPLLDEVELILPLQPPPPAPGSEPAPGCARLIEAVLQGEKNFVHMAGGRQAKPLDDSDPFIIAMAFPTVFPDWRGGARPAGMSLEKYATILVARVPRRQTQQQLFLARLYDILFKLRVRNSTYITARSAPHLVRLAGRVPRNIVRVLAEIMALPPGDKTRAELLSHESAMLQALVTTVRRSAARVDLTDPFYHTAQQIMRCVTIAIGACPMSYNINPSAGHCYMTASSSGEVVEFGAGGRPARPQTAVAMWRRAKATPYAFQAFMVAVEEAINEHLFGWLPGHRRQSNPHCFAGRVLSLESKIEETGRKELHLHGEARLAVFCVERLRAMFDGPNCRTLALAHALCSQWFPDPYYDVSRPEAHVFPAGAASPGTAPAPPPLPDRECPVESYNFALLAGCDADGRPDPACTEACAAYHASVCNTAGTHNHSDTCKRNGCQGVEGDCGMAFGRVLRSGFQWIGESGTFLLPRFGTHLVPHTPGVSMAFGCNHLMSLACEVDRQFTAEVAAELEKPAEERQPLAIFGPASDRAWDASMYIAKYVAKPIKPSQSENTARAIAMCQAYLLQPEAAAAGTEPSAIGNVIVCLLALGRSITVGMNMVAYQLAGHSTFKTTYAVAVLPTFAFAGLALRAAAAGDDEDDQVATMLVQDEADGSFQGVTQVDHYQLRGEELCGVEGSPYMVFTFYKVQRVAASVHEGLARKRRRKPQPAGCNVRQHPASAAAAAAAAAGAGGGEQQAGDTAGPSRSLQRGTAGLERGEAGGSEDACDERSGDSASCMGPLTFAARVPFRRGHPLAGTHMLVRRKHPVYLRLLGALPRRPAPGDEASPAADKYYATMLALFKAYRTSPVPPGMTLRQAFDDWHDRILPTADPTYVTLVRSLLGNIQEVHESGDRRRAEWDQIQRARRDKRGADGGPAGYAGAPSDAEEEDGQEFTVEPQEWRVDIPAELGNESQPPDISTRELDLARDPLSAYDLSTAPEYSLYVMEGSPNSEAVYSANASARCKPVMLPASADAPRHQRVHIPTISEAAALKPAAARVKAYCLQQGHPYGEMDGGKLRVRALRLQQSGGALGPTIAIVDAQEVGTGLRVERELRPGELPPLTPVRPPPTAEQTFQLFTLSEAQGLAFLIMIEYFEACLSGRGPDEVPPPHLLVPGAPGTGKSQLVNAINWHTAQHGQPEWLNTCAYTWTAALAFATSVHRSLSTHATFQLKLGSVPKKGGEARTLVQKHMSGGAVCIDEIGLTSLKHLGVCNMQARDFLSPPAHIPEQHPAVAIFKGRGTMLVGDTCQHVMPRDEAVHSYAAQYLKNPNFTPLLARKRAAKGAAGPAAGAGGRAAARAAAAVRRAPAGRAADGAPPGEGGPAGSLAGDATPQQAAAAASAEGQPNPPADPVLEGFAVYRSCKHVIRLTQQQRQDDTEGGRRLAQAVQLFNGLQDAKREDIVAFLEALNERVVPDLTLLAEFEPRVVLQRNDPRHRLNTRLMQSLALHRQQRPIVWNATHQVVKPRAANGLPPPLPPRPLTRLQKEAALRAPDRLFGGLTGDTWYLPDALFVHLGSGGTDAGACNKNLVRTAGIILDPREPPDDGRGPYWRLRYLPLAVFVRPVNGKLPADIAGEEYADRFPGAFPVLPDTRSTDKAVPLPDSTAPNGVRYAKISRTNISLGDGYAVTDFFVQGASFKNECWAVDLAVPPGDIKRACLYVLLSRYRSWDDIKLLRPLWGNEFQKQQAIAAFMKAARRDEELWAEDQLQRQGERRAREDYKRHVVRARQLVAQRAAAAAQRAPATLAAGGAAVTAAVAAAPAPVPATSAAAPRS